MRKIRQAVAGVTLCLGIAGSQASESVAIKLRIIDGLTEVAISNAKVYLRISGTQVQDLGYSTNGVFSFVHPATNGFVELRVQPENYSSLDVSLTLTNSQIEKEIKLVRTFPFRGVAIAPTGQLASGAQVLILGKQKFIVIKPDAKIEMSSVVLAEEDGSFSVGPEPQGDSILVVHDLGVGQMPVIGWKNWTRIQLRTWTRAAGRMRINNAPAANEGIIANSVKLPGVLLPVQLQGFETHSDAAGNFLFERLPPGEITLFWKTPTGGYSHGLSFIVDPAFPHDLDYHLRGRAIRGQVVVADKDFNWNADHVFASLHSQQAPATEFDPLGVPRMPANFVLKIDQNGKFESDAVQPGNYSMLLRAHGQETIQTTYSSLIVPGGTDPIDLGQIAITNSIHQHPLKGR